MADSAVVYVRNLTHDDIHVIRYLPDGSSDLNIIVPVEDEDRILLVGPELSLGIHAPNVIDTRSCSITVRSDAGLLVKYSRVDSYWTIQIEPDDLPFDVPTTVNITIHTDNHLG